MRNFLIIIFLFTSLHLLAQESKVLNSQESLDKYKLEIKKIEALKLPEDATKIDDIKKAAYKQLNIDLDNARIEEKKEADKRNELSKNLKTQAERQKYWAEEKAMFEANRKIWDQIFAIKEDELKEVQKKLDKETEESKSINETLAKTRIELRDIIAKEQISEKKVIIEVDSATHLGGFVGSVNKGQTISIQYKGGKWSPDSKTLLSPDEVKKIDNAKNYDAGIFIFKEDNSIELISRIPPNTQENSFNFKFENDYAKVILRICDGLLSKELADNKGSVVYEVGLSEK